ncbi:MAG TPA: nuclear transport factor 2 family protein, partial [Dehalococcoidia bacterium]|nr:nuclear transport factor 2 family protein [Dehalococcoidia bacterium]
DLDGYLNNFAPDGEFENERGTIKGREAIGAWVGSIMGVDRVSGMRHFLGLPVIRGDAERCTARTYVMIPRRGDDGEISVTMVGTYRDDIVKIDGEWYFQKRSIFMDMTSESHLKRRAE